jgi:hypothetical protein
MRLHHLGFVVASIDAYVSHLLIEKELRRVEDPLQNAHLALYKAFGSVYIELIEPRDETAFTWNFLQKNGSGFHHLCYAIADEAALQAHTQNMVPIRGPIPAPLFDNAMVWFFMNRNRQIVEFVKEPVI